MMYKVERTGPDREPVGATVRKFFKTALAIKPGKPVKPGWTG